MMRKQKGRCRMSKKNACACGSTPKLVFACSGAADVGTVADAATAKLAD